MMATLTRPVEEAVKNMPGTVTIRSTTGGGCGGCVFRLVHGHDTGGAVRAGRLAQIRTALPPSAEFAVHRVTFSASPIIGHSLTSRPRSIADCGSLRSTR